MKALRSFMLAAVVGCFISGFAPAQTSPLKNRSSLELNVGVWTGPRMSEVKPNSFYPEGSHFSSPFDIELLWAYPLSRQVSVTLSVGALAGMTDSFSDPLSVGPTEDYVGFIAPAMVGVRYYFPSLISTANLRPFASAAIGVETGYQLTNSTESPRSWDLQRALGGGVGSGIEYSLTDHLDLLLKVRYLLASRFVTPVGTRLQYNGLSLLFGTGLLF